MPKKSFDWLPNVPAIDVQLISKADELLQSAGQAGPSRSWIKEINRIHGTDVATACLYSHFRHRLPTIGETASVESSPLDATRPWKLLIVPGAFYKQHPETGGDGRALIELAGQYDWDCERIETESLGTVAENARIISQAILRNSATHQILLVSLSKGAMDASVALNQNPQCGSHVKACVHVSGILSGTMMADWLLDKWRLRWVQWWMCRKHKADVQAIRDLRHRTSGTHFIADPDSIVFHVAGFPLKKHLSNWRARLWHRRLRRCGPNDSVIDLCDLLDLPGTVLPVWGADHYLQSDWEPSAAVARLIRHWTTAPACQEYGV